MKIRTDFVTNSSSSSFILIKIKSDKFINILEQYSGLIIPEDEYYADLKFDVNKETNIAILQQEESWVDFSLNNETLPSLIDTTINCLEELFTDFYYYDDEEEDVSEQQKAFIEDLRNNKNELIESVEEIELVHTESGWEGDSDCRFYQDWYEKDTLNEILEEIAKNNECTIEEVDDEMFSEFVCCRISEECYTINYNKESGKVISSRTTELI